MQIRSVAFASTLLAATLATQLCLGSPGTELQPPTGAARALLFDLEKMIESQQSLGWTIDRYEYEDLLSPALTSVCSSTNETHQVVLAYLRGRMEALGGPVEQAYKRSGGDMDAIEELLFVTRVHTLFEEALRRAPDECPFWMQPQPGFKGVQTDAYRYTINFEGGGLLVLQHVAGKVIPGGGGSGRLLLGRGLSESWTFLAGGEFGGIALFDQSDTETHFPISFNAGLPLVLRHHDLTWHYDFELTPFAYFAQVDTRPSPGIRGGLLVGISALRVRNIMPWAGIGMAFEYVFDTPVRPSIWSLRAGARVGFDWDF